MFIYESCCPTPAIPTEMSGYFTFRYLNGDKKGQKFDAMINTFILNVDAGTILMDNPMKEAFSGHF